MNTKETRMGDSTKAPFLRVKKTTKATTWKWIAATLPILITAIFYFRWNAVERFGVTIFAAILGEFFGRYFAGRKIALADGNSILTGILLACMLPPVLPVWICFVGGFMAVLFFREFFGGVHQSLFHPVLVTYVFLIASFPLMMNNFVDPFDLKESVSPLLLWKEQTQVFLSQGTLILGNYADNLGVGSCAAILLGGIFLVANRLFYLEIPFLFLTVFAACNYIFNIPFELSLLAGSSMFVAFFILPDYATTPHHRKAVRLYVVVVALLSSFIQKFSFFADGVPFAVVLGSCFIPWFDRLYRPHIGDEKC